MFTSDCRWQRRLAVKNYVGFLEQNGRADEKLTEMVCIFIFFVDVNTKQENMPPSTRVYKEYKSHSVLRMWRALGDPFLHFAIIRGAIQKGRLFS